ncbi:tRNA (guanosine(37)-N1)-methyltransferase TrmD [Zavarzinia sp. CC-PAN008]|uniref:tRNA (guanosine(37)-N1)-methyltransferase TrmD n=1 Tax=Zavarzinia sp. CC-PAN008 TaxID=3243332 RepID=UPI003F748F50
MTWQARVLTLFPAMFPGPLGLSLAGRALEAGAWRLDAVDIRGFASGRARMVDDTPAGGGPGMVMRADVLARAIDATHPADGSPLIYLSPRGQRIDQARVKALADGPGVTLVCGRFEGVDQRILDGRAVEELSLGDFVLSGGEPAAIALLDAVVRLLPGTVGAEETLAEESFEDGLLEYPHYTRPRVFEGMSIPEVLLGGDHAAIRAWRMAERRRITRERRPDLWQTYVESERHP